MMKTRISPSTLSALRFFLAAVLTALGLLARPVALAAGTAETAGAAFEAAGTAGTASGAAFSRYDYDFVKGSQPWLFTRNPAGLGRLGGERLVNVRAAFEKENGGFRPCNASPDSYSAGLDAEAYTPLGKRIHLSGEVGYTYFYGKNMTASAWADPSLMPFDLLEDASDAGAKQRERYHLAGGISFEAFRDFCLGARVNYTSGNYVKMKDLRHNNQLLDLSVDAGLSWHPGAWGIGLNYSYRRRVETLAFQQSGESARSYSELISYGAFYGRRQIFSANTYVSSESQPLRDGWHGGALQLSYALSGGGKLLGEALASFRSGSYGIPGSKNVEYARHRGTDLRARAFLLFPSGENEHRVQLEAGYAALSGFENVYRYLNDPSTGNTVVDYLGVNEVSRRLDLDALAAYKLYIGTGKRLPVWTVSAALQGLAQKTDVSLYPFWRQQRWFSLGLNASLARVFLWGGHLLSAGVDAGFSAGGGTPVRDGTFLPSAEGSTRPAEEALYLWQEYEFRTKPCLRLALPLRYGYLFARRYDASVGLDLGWQHAFGTSYVGCDRFSLRLKLQLVF